LPKLVSFFFNMLWFSFIFLLFLHFYSALRALVVQVRSLLKPKALAKASAVGIVLDALESELSVTTLEELGDYTANEVGAALGDVVPTALRVKLLEALKEYTRGKVFRTVSGCLGACDSPQPTCIQPPAPSSIAIQPPIHPRPVQDPTTHISYFGNAILLNLDKIWRRK
jgi:hypothetical protein